MLPVFALLLLQTSEVPRQISAPACPTAMLAEKRVQAEYPKASYKTGTEGLVELEGLVSTDGQVRDVVVASGDPELAKAAVAAFRKWKYAPCMVGGKPTESSVSVSFAFKFKRQEQYASSCPSFKWGSATPPPPAEEGTRRVRVNAGVTGGALMYGPKPDYPVAARLQHLGGSVVMCAIIGKDGAIKELGVLQGHPILADAAVAAVKQWRYKPYKLQGEPVEVDTVITVNFQPQ